MNLSEIRNMIYMMLQETGSNSVFSQSTIDALVNSRYFRICRSKPWSFLVKESRIPVTCTTISSESSGNILNVNSVSGMAIGRKITVMNATDYEEVQIGNIIGDVITLTGSGLVRTYSSGDRVCINNYYLPSDCWKLISVRDLSVPRCLKVIDVNQADHSIPRRSSSGEALMFYVGGTDISREPLLSGSYSMSSGSNSTDVICSSLSGNTDDYYSGWVLTNITTGASKRIRSYNSSLKKIILEESISGQTAGNSFYLAPDLVEIFLYPVPDNNGVLDIRYRMIPPKLFNNYDMPVLPEAYHILIVYGVMIDLGISDRNNPRAAKSINLFETLEHELFLQMSDEFSSITESEIYAMKAVDDDTF